MVRVEFTEDECDFIRAILYGALGGNQSGPRKIAESIAEKLPWHIPTKFVATVESVNRYDNSKAVVVREKTPINPVS